MPNKLNSLGDRIRELREKAKLEQKGLAELAQVSPGAVSQWESGATQPGKKARPALAKALGVSVSDLFNDESPVAAPPRKPNPEEMALYVLEALKIPEEKLGAIRAVLFSEGREMVAINAACVPVEKRLISLKKSQTTG